VWFRRGVAVFNTDGTAAGSVSFGAAITRGSLYAQNLRRLQEMKPEVRAMFSEVEQLVRLMLLCPVSSCEAERSFSSLRRLKTWLRNTMTQERLNSVVVCHVHQKVMDDIDLSEIAADFAGRSDIRKSMFGNGPF